MSRTCSSLLDDLRLQMTGQTKAEHIGFDNHDDKLHLVKIDYYIIWCWRKREVDISELCDHSG